MGVQQSEIAKKIVDMTTGLHYVVGSVTKNVPPLVAYVEETDSVPFCCYRIESDSARYCKRGVCGWNSSASIYVVSDSEDEANLIKDAIIDAIETYRSATFYPKLSDITPAYEDMQWLYRIDYNFITLY